MMNFAFRTRNFALKTRNCDDFCRQGHMKSHFDDLRLFEEVDGAGHWLPLEAAEEVSAKIRK